MLGALPISARLSRGVILYAELDKAYLADPAKKKHHKYLVVLNCDPKDAEVIFVMATSKVARFEQLKHLKAETVPLLKETYAFLTEPATVLDFTDVCEMPMSTLKAMVDKKKVTVIGKLTDGDLKLCDDVIAVSRHIEPRLLPRIRCGDLGASA